MLLLRLDCALPDERFFYWCSNFSCCSFIS
ncbi:hypothetical protein Goari_007104 [Gossypium aridum]|uniref:Uncharacterized protein n=1 Tax=Gossypium aridum TaxID=34290 RepID=A0A7J8XQ31_GOSAI|nr:hypothetical protein [Gossypium aridum]